MYKMPVIPLDQLKPMLTEGEYKLVAGVVTTKGVNKGRLLTTKPKIKFNKVIEIRKRYNSNETYESDEYYPNARQGATAYIWRMLAFHLCSWAPHSCLPMTTSFNLRVKVCTDQEKKLCKKLDSIVEKTLSVIPKDQWGGILAWKAALYGQ